MDVSMGIGCWVLDACSRSIGVRCFKMTPVSQIPVAILAGGIATRLRPITEKIPKALVPVAGEPFIKRQLGYLRSQGIDRAVLCVGYLGDQTEAVVGDGRSLGMEVRYSFDGERLLGTGGALRR